MAEWTKLRDGDGKECASDSCEHAPASWFMKAGDVGSYYCDDCRRSIVSFAVSDCVHDFAMTVRGMAPVAGTDPTAGAREYDITLSRDGYEDVHVAQMFTDTAETFDPTEAVEITSKDDPDVMHRLRVGDVLTVRVSICQ